MKLIRIISLAVAFALPVAAFASPPVQASCCPGHCCPGCPFCPSGLHR
jgi:hypothetical protein